MPSAGLLAVAFAAALVALAAAALASRGRQRARLLRLEEGIAELARGNLAHRVILPGDDAAARMAEAVNRLADAVQAERERAAAQDEARRRVLANVSHDLRTPITSIGGYVDAIQRGLGDEPERYLAVIATKAEELAQLTDDLFYAARLDAGDLRLESSPLDLAEAVRRSVLGFEPELRARGVRVEVHLPSEPCVIVADPSAVARILGNLVSNAARHAEGMTALSVRLNRRDGECAVAITNDGARLPEDAEALFARGVAGSGGGAGLGLSIARELAERMGAHVAARDSDGRTDDGGAAGVTFTVEFRRS